MAESQLNMFVEWYRVKRPLYEELSTYVRTTLQNILIARKIDHLSITSRTKEPASFVEKIKRKGYQDLEAEFTDLSGIRIITFIETDVVKVSELIETTFEVHPSKSLDKTGELGVDRVGYRSVHLICELREDRVQLEECSKFKGLFFEIQVRTVLQHAWAEIEHNRNYKFSGQLPNEIKRRLYCLAGMLEVADREFANVAGEIDRYSVEVTRRASSGDLDIEINKTSLLSYLPLKLRAIENRGVEIHGQNVIPKVIIEELNSFGVHTLSDLDLIMSDGFLNSVAKHQSYTTYAGILRDSMMYADIDRYFSEAWKNNWMDSESETFEVLSDKYGSEKVEQIFQDNGIQWS